MVPAAGNGLWGWQQVPREGQGDAWTQGGLAPRGSGALRAVAALAPPVGEDTDWDRRCKGCSGSLGGGEGAGGRVPAESHLQPALLLLQ